MPLQPSGSFQGLGIAPRLLDALERLHFTIPTPIQQQAIPIAVEGKDVIGIAQTGTGKTLAFGVPMLQRLAQVKGRGLVVLPTRELALQVDESLHTVARQYGLRTAVLIGGASMPKQVAELRGNPHVIIATPGRLIDHLTQRTVTLTDVTILVLDEADRMLDMGFAPQLNRILAAVPPVAKRQTMLFSATMPDQIVTIARKHMSLPVRVEIARSGTAAENVVQEVFIVRKEDKTRLLEKLVNDTRGSILVFMRTKHTAKRLTRSVRAMGHSAAEIHANRSLNQRREALDGFKSGQYRILIATDIAARGIDVHGIELVVNFDLPSTPEDYVHRIGRTGRAGAVGHAITFVMPDQQRELRGIERLTQLRLPVTPLPELPPHRPQPFVPARQGFSHGRSPRRPGGFRARGNPQGQSRSSRRPRRSAGASRT